MSSNIWAARLCKEFRGRVLVIGWGECMGGTSTPRLQHPITTVRTLAPYDVASARWQHPYPGSFGFTCVQWETWRPSLYTVWTHTRSDRHLSYSAACRLYLWHDCPLLSPLTSPHVSSPPRPLSPSTSRGSGVSLGCPGTQGRKGSQELAFLDHRWVETAARQHFTVRLLGNTSQ